MIARFEIEGNGWVCVQLQIGSKNFLRDVIVIQLIIAQCNIHIKRKVVPKNIDVLKKQITNEILKSKKKTVTNLLSKSIFLYMSIDSW